MAERRAFLNWKFVMTENRRSNRLAFILVWSILLYFFCQRYVISLGVVTDRSMVPLLYEGGYFLVNKYIYHFAPPQRGDIVVLRSSAYDEEQYVKRVVGLEGETIQFLNGAVLINGRRLDEPYVKGRTYAESDPHQIREGTYFVLGDNRLSSYDSRQFGPVARKDLVGRITPGRLFSFR